MAGVAGSRTQVTSGLSHQCSVTEPRQPDSHQPSQSSICYQTDFRKFFQLVTRLGYGSFSIAVVNVLLSVRLSLHSSYKIFHWLL